ncbi:MAG TPA: (2Fe-2S)-binding protein [Haliangium sp.]|nr:(2Fe-2S)-binding protein [Haliangium sp.]
MPDKTPISLTINGETHDLLVSPRRTLLDVMREDLRLTGAKRGCDQGVCGACLVLVDGEPMCSCLALAVSMTDRTITTVEGLGAPSVLHAVQQALVDHGAIQCGFCMPGMALAGKALLDRNPSPTVDEIRDWLGGNLCRCSGYVKVVNAIHSLGQEADHE